MATFVPHAELAKLLGTQSLQTEARSVGELIDEIQGRLGKEKWKRVRRATILVNGRNINGLQGRDTPLGPADVVWMIVPSAGG